MIIAKSNTIHKLMSEVLEVYPNISMREFKEFIKVFL